MIGLWTLGRLKVLFVYPHAKFTNWGVAKLYIVPKQKRQASFYCFFPLRLRFSFQLTEYRKSMTPFFFCGWDERYFSVDRGGGNTCWFFSFSLMISIVPEIRRGSKFNLGPAVVKQIDIRERWSWIQVKKPTWLPFWLFLYANRGRSELALVFIAFSMRSLIWALELMMQGCKSRFSLSSFLIAVKIQFKYFCGGCWRPWHQKGNWLGGVENSVFSSYVGI